MLFSATVPSASGFFELLSVNPALGYLVFATFLLAGVALASGIVRGDFLALSAWSTSAKIVLAIAAAVALAHGADALGHRFGPESADDWWPTGLYRLPLYALGLAYGPSVGVVIACAYLIVAAVGLTPEPASAILALELLVLGWLAIYPSPERHRWAGPLDAVLAYGLAWLTAGLTVLSAAHGTVSLAAINEQHEGMLIAMLVIVAALWLVHPRRYRQWFPESRVHAEEASDPS